MTRLVPALIVLGLLSAATQSSAACRWFGTQLECELGGSQLSFGTQAADEPAYARAFRPQPFHGNVGVLDGRVASGWPLRLEIQDVGTDPRLCRKLGNETYCH